MKFQDSGSLINSRNIMIEKEFVMKEFSSWLCSLKSFYFQTTYLNYIEQSMNQTLILILAVRLYEEKVHKKARKPLLISWVPSFDLF